MDISFNLLNIIELLISFSKLFSTKLSLLSIIFFSIFIKISFDFEYILLKLLILSINSFLFKFIFFIIFDFLLK